MAVRLINPFEAAVSSPEFRALAWSIVEDFPSRMGYHVFTWSVAMLALGHLGSVFLHQGTRSNTMARMGIRGVSTASRE
jgi:hypothetical protein